MPDSELLEEYPLYRKKIIDYRYKFDLLDTVSINMYCHYCGSNQTFNMENKYWEGIGNPNAPTLGEVVRLVYVCAHCKTYARYFLIEFGEEKYKDKDTNEEKTRKYITKVGQYPNWDITPQKELSESLGNSIEIYKKALICESQSYGIGAYAYYRRIVELVITELIDDIADLVDHDKEKYLAALEEAKKETQTANKIQLIKDLLPAILRPNDINPLSVLYERLSTGLHGESDETCMEYAEEVRQAIEFLVKTVKNTKSASKGFTAGMKKILDKKASASKSQTGEK